MRKMFKVEKIPLKDIIEALSILYDKGFDYIDMYSDGTNIGQDKLIIQTKNEYYCEDAKKDNEEELSNLPATTTNTTTEFRLSEDTLNELI